MIKASGDTLRLVGVLFSEADVADATKLIEEDCADNLPFHEEADSESLERVRFAALKLSEGRLGMLVDAIALAQTDWRDLLVSAGFAEDLNAHVEWSSSVLS